MSSGNHYKKTGLLCTESGIRKRTQQSTQYQEITEARKSKVMAQKGKQKESDNVPHLMMTRFAPGSLPSSSSLAMAHRVAATAKEPRFLYLKEANLANFFTNGVPMTVNLEESTQKAMEEGNNQLAQLLRTQTQTRIHRFQKSIITKLGQENEALRKQMCVLEAAQGQHVDRF